MRVAINTYGMAPGCGGGEESFLRHVLAEMVKLQDHTQFTILTDEANHESYAEYERCNVDEAGGVDEAVGKSKADLLFSSYTRIPENISSPYIALALNLPVIETMEKPKRFFKGKSAPSARDFLFNATLVICPSEYMKQALLDRLQIPLNKISIAFPGVAPVFGEKQRCIVQQPYALMVGGTHSRKNITGALDAFYKVAGEMEHNLVVVGHPGASEPADWGDRVIRFEWLGNSQLAGIYQHTDVLIHSAYDDGSGISILEALKSGCLIAAGRVGAIPEIARDAPLYFNPESGDSMVGVLRRAMQEDEGERLRRIKAGKQLIVERTWESCAWKLLSQFSKSGI